MYQEVDAFLTEQLRQPYPVTNWQNWPTLYSFCQSLATIASRRGYSFYIGEKRYGMNDQKEQIAPVHRYCHPGPSLSTLDEKKAEPMVTSGVHLENVALLLHILQTLDGIPCYQNNSVLKFLGIMHYDGMPLNIGTFPRPKGKTVVFDGITPPISLNQMVGLQRDGAGSLKKYISEHCEWISEVNEYDITDASGSFYINAYTEYATTKGTANKVKEAVSTVRNSIEVCQQCIKEHRQVECTFTTFKEACNRCKTLQSHGQDVKCTSFKVLHCLFRSSISTTESPFRIKPSNTKSDRRCWLRAIRFWYAAFLQECHIIRKELQVDRHVRHIYYIYANCNLGINIRGKCENERSCTSCSLFIQG